MTVHGRIEDLAAQEPPSFTISPTYNKGHLPFAGRCPVLEILKMKALPFVKPRFWRVPPPILLYCKELSAYSHSIRQPLLLILMSVL